LYECRRNIANNEDPEDEFRRHWRVFSPVDADHDGDERVDGRGEEHRCDDDEEVLLPSARASHVDSERKAKKSHLDHKPRYRVRILLAREYAERVSNDLHHSSHNYGAEIPCAMAQEQNEMGCQSNGK
jgi:hypothetical protein